MNADIIIGNGAVYSVLLDGSEIHAQAVAISGGKILAVGTDEEMRSFADENTTFIDAEGGSILPGLCDAHCHATWSGSAMIVCDLFHLPAKRKAALAELKRRLQKYIADHPEDEYIKGTGWDFMVLGTGAHRKILDEICPDRPVFLESYCQHHLWTNTKALEAAGITKDIPDVKAGTIHRDKNGELTGVFSEFSAMDKVKSRIPRYDMTVEAYEEIILRYQKESANAYGVTMIFDALSSENAKKAYQNLARQGRLTLRVADNEYADPEISDAQFDDIITRKGSRDVGDLYRVNTVKFFLEANAPDMCLLKPYRPLAAVFLGKPVGYRGYLFWEQERLNKIMTKLMDAGFQAHFHAMGDGSVRQAVQACAFGRQQTGRDTRNTIAHLMIVDPEDIQRMGENHIIACLQPTWMASPRSEITTSIFGLGKERELNTYPYKRFLDAGVICSAGTDYPVMPPPDPFIELAHAQNRKLCKGSPLYDGSGVMTAPKNNPQQDVVTLRDWLCSRTISGAYQCFAEDFTGSLEPGKSADVIVLDRNLEETKQEELYETKVRYTFFKGRLVYEDQMKL